MSVTLPQSVLILGSDAANIAAALRATLPQLDVRVGGGEPDGPYAVIGFSPGAMIANYTKAKWVHISGAGANGMLAALGAARIKPALITRTLGGLGHQIGEYVLSYALADAQKHAVRRRLQTDRIWDVAAGTPTLVSNWTVLVLGTGGIGAGVAKVLGAVGMDCIGASRSGQAREGFSRVVTMTALPEMPNVNMVVGALPLTPETKHGINARVFGQLKGALFINVGRGATADMEALKAALADGLLRHAVLDVVPVEPLPDRSDLWGHPKVTITPHVSGLTRPEDTAAAFSAAYRALERGEIPELIVDADAGY